MKQTEAGQVRRLFIGGVWNGRHELVEPDRDVLVVPVSGPPAIVKGVYGPTTSHVTYRRELISFGGVFVVPVFVEMKMGLKEAWRLGLPHLLSHVALESGTAT